MPIRNNWCTRCCNTRKEKCMEESRTILQGGTVVCENEVLPHHDVVLYKGRIEAVRPSTLCDSEKNEYSRSAQHLIDSAQSIVRGAAEKVGSSAPHIVDARGAYVLPGFIDIHSDYIETVASPRPRVIMDLESSLYEAERELIAHGVTTMFHSLSVYQMKIFDHKPIRNFENVSALMSHVNRLRTSEEYGHLIRHRLHLRVELDAVDLYEEVKTYLENGFVDLISFMDHTPGQGQYADIQLFGDTLKGYRDITDEEIATTIALQQQSSKLSLAHMVELSRIAQNLGIAIASHDDDSDEKLDVMESIHAKISEFPITLPVAQSARARGMHTLAGAPNVLMGHSHSGNLSAREAICAEAIDILCSDYYPAALLSAVFTLHRTCGIDLSKAVALVSSNPARATYLDKELGSITPGKCADLLIVRELTPEKPVVTQAFIGGCSVYEAQYPKFLYSKEQFFEAQAKEGAAQTDLVWSEMAAAFVEIPR